MASQLQSEQFLSRDIKHRFGDMDGELKTVKEKLHFKDEEMIRLTHENAQFDAKIQELGKKLDTNSNDSVRQVIELQKKLHSANKEIKHLREKINGTSKGNGDNGASNLDENISIGENLAVEGHSHEHSHEHGHDHGSHDHSDDQHHHHHHNCSHSDGHHDHGTDYGNEESKFAVEALDNSDVVSVTSTINIATNEAMEKLQDRFKRTMNEIADLTEEKHRLEHLVTQLQSETETIGEYIALYQTQRRILKQREIEKDIQLNRIAADREDMKDKLRQLNELVELLLVQKGFSNAKEIMAQLNTVNNNSETIAENCKQTPVNGTIERDDASTSDTIDSQHIKATNLINFHHNNHAKEHEHDHSHGHGHSHDRDHDHDHDHEHHSHGPSNLHTHLNANTRETATKIINLLTDIKDKNLRQDYTVGPNSVDHCSCCSGKLEVV